MPSPDFNSLSEFSTYFMKNAENQEIIYKEYQYACKERQRYRDKDKKRREKMKAANALLPPPPPKPRGRPRKDTQPEHS